MQYRRAIAIVGADPAIDSLMAIYIPPLVTRPEEVAAAIAEAAGAVPAHKPVATVFMSAKGTPELLSHGPRGRIPSYSFPENAAMALAAAVRYGRWRRRPTGHVHTFEPARERAIRACLERLRAAGQADAWVSFEGAAELLELAGVAVAPFRHVAPDPRAAAHIAEELGFPVVLKAEAPGLLHKTEVGGVVLGLSSTTAVRRAAEELSRRLPVSGFLVQRQVEGGVEALVGITADPSLGPLLVTGLGGVQVELLRDVAFRLTPVSDVDATEMLAGLRAQKLLDGWRGAPPADRKALVELMLRISALVEIAPELAELDLNPVKVMPPGRGAIVLDARLRLTAETAA